LFIDWQPNEWLLVDWFNKPSIVRKHGAYGKVSQVHGNRRSQLGSKIFIVNAPVHSVMEMLTRRISLQRDTLKQLRPIGKGDQELEKRLDQKELT
jgi:cell shape-determining protein MreC